MVEVSVPIKPFLCGSSHLPVCRKILVTKTWKFCGVVSSSSSCGYNKGRNDGQVVLPKKTRRVFFLDVNPLCYAGSKPSLHSFARWVSLFFNQVSLSDPVIAVVDGERGNEHRRQLLPSYKTHRWKFLRQFSKGHVGRSHGAITNVFRKCNVPVIKIEGHEADDVIATLVEQVLHTGYQVVIASPDKDFKQLLSEDVQIVMPLDDLERWSFYTLKHYMAQYNCDPCCDLSLRCIVGDQADGVPGIQHLAPGFGQKTALKLLKKHGSLENLLNVASVRTVGRQYAQDALTKYADHLRRNYEILSLRRDVNVQLKEEWLVTRDTSNDSKLCRTSLSSWKKLRSSVIKMDLFQMAKLIDRVCFAVVNISFQVMDGSAVKSLVRKMLTGLRFHLTQRLGTAHSVIRKLYQLY